MGVLEEVKNYFIQSGLRLVFEENPNVFERVVREFAYSFVPEYFVINRVSYEEQHVAKRNLRLGGKKLSFGADELRVALRTFDGSVYPRVPKSTKDEFWRKITWLNEDYKPSQKTTKLRTQYRSSCINSLQPAYTSKGMEIDGLTLRTWT